MPKVIALQAVADDRREQEAKLVRASLFQQCRMILDDLGTEASGFALVVWTRDGDLRSGLDTGFGPIKPPLVPTLASDALNRHVSLALAPAQELTS